MFRWGVGVMVFVGFILGGAVGFLWWKIVTPPVFYVERINLQSVAGNEQVVDLEKQTAEFREQAAEAGKWSVTIAEDDINRWLAEVLPVKHAGVLPPEVSNPRIAFQEGNCQLGVTVKTRLGQTVLWLDTRFEKLSEPNAYAIHIQQLRAGSLGIPLSYVERSITQALSRQRITSAWSDSSGGRILRVKLDEPLSLDGQSNSRIREIKFSAGEMMIEVETE
jgi:hypothetical protein